MTIDYILAQIPLTPEKLILILRVGGVVAGLLAIRCLFRAISLNNSLSIAKAQYFIYAESNFTAPTITEQSMPKLEIHTKEEPAKPKRPLLYFTISEDAQKLLEKVSVEVSFEDGWCGIADGTQRSNAL